MNTHYTDKETCTIREQKAAALNQQGANPFYQVYLFEGKGTFTIDHTSYAFNGKIVLFSTPWQQVHLDLKKTTPVRVLQFHGDFYCIEYHKKEVACNGLLFNNIYGQPFITASEATFAELHQVFDRLRDELKDTHPYAQAVTRTYLQLVLALSSKIKAAVLPAEESPAHHPVKQFMDLLDKHFLRERTPAFYAARLGLAPNTFSKQCKAHFHKSPSRLIQERVILEAKKRIHLTTKSMKEIAAELHFDDEHYFSRYFKKHTKISPTAFRETVGISIVAHLPK